MLDVHAPHEAARTWTDFFIHIGTIVVGLLIAVGLEQGVEWFHHRHQASELRESLHRERERNYRNFERNAALWRVETAGLQNNLTILTFLQQHPNTRQEDLPGEMYWHYEAVSFERSAWDSALQNGTAQLLPQEELNENAQLYKLIALIEEAQAAVNVAIIDADRFRFTDADLTHLAANQVNDAVALWETALTKQYMYGIFLGNLQETRANFPSSKLLEYVRQIHQLPDETASSSLSRAHDQTMRRLKAAGYDTRWGTPESPNTPNN
jgi:hypothetical protein